MNQQTIETESRCKSSVPVTPDCDWAAVWRDTTAAGLTSRPWMLTVASMACVTMACVTIVSLATAGYFAGLSAARRADNPTAANAFPFPMPSTIDAVGAVSSEKFSIATGVVSEEAEGFFVLDHNSGIVQCSVFYPRVGKFMASFTGNAGELVGAGGKGGSYLMVTGQADMTRGGRPGTLAPTLLYVLNTATGNYGVFSVPFDRQALAQGRPQQGVMIPMGTGTAALVPTR
jgi:hypothetical protein